MTKPNHELPAGTACTDSPISAIRSSTYFILRAAFPSLGFDSSGDDHEHRQERSLLQAAAASLLRPPTERGESSAISLRVAELASTITLGKEVVSLRNRSFTKQMLTLEDRRKRLLESLSRLAQSIKGMGYLHDRLTQHAEKVNTFLVEDAACYARRISATVVVRNIRLLLLGVDIPSHGECEASVRRWSAVFSSADACDEPIAHVREMCYPSQGESPDWVADGLDILRSGGLLDKALAVLVPLLTLGECEAPLKFFEKCEEPQDDRLRVSLHALRTWAFSLLPSPSIETLLKEWTDFEDSLEALERAVSEDTETGPRDRWLMAAWVAVYVSSRLRDLGSRRDALANLSPVVARGKKCVDRILELQQLEDPLCQMAWAARLVLLANVAWCGGDVKELSSALSLCQQAVKNEPCLYLTNARYWAAYVNWQQGDRAGQTLVGAQLATMQGLAFERFQAAVKELIRQGS